MRKRKKGKKEKEEEEEEEKGIEVVFKEGFYDGMMR